MLFYEYYLEVSILLYSSVLFYWFLKLLVYKLSLSKPYQMKKKIPIQVPLPTYHSHIQQPLPLSPQINYMIDNCYFSIVFHLMMEVTMMSLLKLLKLQLWKEYCPTTLKVSYRFSFFNRNKEYDWVFKHWMKSNWNLICDSKYQTHHFTKKYTTPATLLCSNNDLLLFAEL